MRVFGPGLGVGLDAGHLRHEQGALKFSHPQVGAIGAVAEAGADVLRPAAVIVEGVAALAQIFVVAEDGAALARVEVLGRLEAEATRLSVSTQLAPFPLRQVGLAGILYR